MIVAIQPAYGDAWTRRQFAATLNVPVSFRAPHCYRHLTRTELSQLNELHPQGRAACWGGTRQQRAKITELRHGDLVLLTGQRHLRGVGQVGAVVDNPDLARALWGLHPRRCSFEIVYSLEWFRRVEVPYRVLQRALGTSQGDNFQGMRLIRDSQRATAVGDLVDREIV